MPKPTFHNLPDAKRQRIIDAAIEEFASQPYAKATLDNIVAAAGISKGSMYQYFGGKSDLYQWLLTSYMAEKKMAAIGAEAPPPDASVWVILESAFLAGVHFSVAEPQLTRLGARFMRDYEQEPELAAISAANKAAGAAWLTGLMEMGKARGELRADLDVPIAVSFLAHALGEGIVEQLARLLGMSLSEYLAHPEATKGLDDQQLLDLVRGVTRLFRDGAGTGGAS